MVADTKVMAVVKEWSILRSFEAVGKNMILLEDRVSDRTLIPKSPGQKFMLA